MEKEKAVIDTEAEDKVSLDSLVVGEEITPDTYVDMFGEEPIGPAFENVEDKNEENKVISNPTDPKEFYEDLENKKRFVKHLNPEYKANIVYQGMVSNPKEYPDIPRVGHAKRIFLRKLIREAKKGKLDKFFLK